VSSPPAVPPEVVEFLRRHPPFDAVDVAEVERVAATAEIEFHRAGTVIFSQGTGPVDHLRVIRRGAVELVHDGRVLDLLGDGELFGHASMLSGLPTGFEARAAEDTLCYRIDAETARELLSAPAGLRFVARSLLDWPDAGSAAARPHPAAGAIADAREDPAELPVGRLVRGSPIICAPETTIREVAQQMAAVDASAAVVKLADGTLGILTDRDLRERVLADGLGGDARVFEAMSAPAYSCGPDRLGGEVLLEMLDRGFRHLPVVSVAGEVLGVIEDRDLVALHARSYFFLRRRITRAETVDEVVAAGLELPATVIAMADARVATAAILAVRAVVVDALTRRLLELAVGRLGKPSTPFAWLALGSQARREAAPSADVDSAIVWFGEDKDPALQRRLVALARLVVDGLERCGLPPDEHGATASGELFVRSLSSWQRAARSWIADPAQEQALVLASVLVDSRPVWGIHMGTPVSDTFRLAPRNPQLLRLLARLALSYRPPTGFFRGLVVEHSGEHRGRLDLKHGGVLPIVDLARWAGMSAGVTSASTVERLRAAAAAGTLTQDEAQTLIDAFELIGSLRLSHQVDQLRAGEPPDDYLDPATLSPLMRGQLKEAFRAVAAFQRRVSNELSLGVR
jgi:CBS domain-containing protein